MEGRRLQPGWPTRQVRLTVAGIDLALRVPEHPYALLDLPAVERAFDEDEYMPYWAHLWPASLMLGRWLVERAMRPGESPPRVALPSPPARVLEIGCGLGVPGLLAAKLGYRATLTDYDPDALEYLRHNAELNQLKVVTAKLDWRRRPGDRFPLILAADVLYEQRSHQSIFEFLRLSMETSGIAALADPHRPMADLFLHDAPGAGWQAQVEPARWENTDGRIILLRRGGS